MANHKIKILLLLLLSITVIGAQDNAKIEKYLEVSGIAPQLRNLPKSLLQDFNDNMAMDTIFFTQEYLTEFGHKTLESVIQENKEEILKAPLDEIITWFEKPVGKKLRARDTHWIIKDDIPADSSMPEIEEEKQEMLDNLIDYIELREFSDKMTEKIGGVAFKAMCFAEAVMGGQNHDTVIQKLSSEKFDQIIKSTVKKFIAAGELERIDYENAFYHDYGFLTIDELDELTIFLTEPSGQEHIRIYFMLIDKCLDSINANLEYFKI